MSGSRRPRSEVARLQELAADRACQALGPAESVEFARLVAESPDFDFESFERAAAAVHLASVRPARVSGSLRDRLIADADVFVNRPRAARPAPRAVRSTPRLEERGPSLLSWSGWVAAAAAVVLAIVWRARDEVVYPVDARQELFAKASDERVFPWAATEDPAAAGASGDVLWSTALQEGFLRIGGLAPNDPAVSQYQLWIFDATRTEDNSVAGAGAIPVDGGVFDVSGDGEVVIPIDAKLRVGEPTLFAVTVEKPGGVTVSKQERIVLAAAVE